MKRDMSDFVKERVNKNVEKYNDVIPSLITAHLLSGCDTAPTLFGIGKGKVLNVVKTHPLHFLGKESSDVNDFMQEGKQFIVWLYGMKEFESSRNRFV